jgi:hypothetical protein
LTAGRGAVDDPFMRRIGSRPGAALAFAASLVVAACGGSTSGTDAGSGDGAAGDAASGSDGGANPCAPGTCRFPSDPTAQCLPPGGPISQPDSAPSLSGCCACGSDGFCSSECKCASPDTPVATPSGDRPIASLAVGDLVLSVDHGEVVAVPLRATHRSPVRGHVVVELTTSEGAVVHVSAVHPTADGRTFGDLRAGDWVGGVTVTSARVVPYAHDATYDVLPDSDTGAYFAGGVLVGSTLAPPRPRGHERACAAPR